MAPATSALDDFRDYRTVQERAIAPYEYLALVCVMAWLVVLQLQNWPVFFYPSFPKFGPSNTYMDSAVFTMAGDLLRQGGTPYVTYWDHQPPLIHLLDALGLLISGGQLWGVWLVSLSSLMLAGFLAYAALRHLFGAAVAVFGTTYFVASLRDILSSNVVEEYVLPLQWAVVLLLVQWQRFERRPVHLGTLLGVLIAGQAWLRPNLAGAGLSGLLAVSALYAVRRSPRPWLRFVGGVAVGLTAVTLMITGYLALHGSLAAFWDAVIRYNWLYIAASWKLRVRTALQGFVLIGFYAPLLLPLAGWLLALRLTSQRSQHPSLFLVAVLAVVWLPLEALCGAVSGRDYGHYFIPLLSPMALLATIVLWQLADVARAILSPGSRSRAEYLLLVFAVGVWIFPVGDTVITLAYDGLEPRRAAQIDPAVRYITQQTAPDERILVWGQAPDLYFLSGRAPATRFIYPFPLLTPDYVDAGLIRIFMDELHAHPPALIIDAPDLGVRRPDKPVFVEPTGEAVTPSLASWDPQWQHPDPRRPEFSWWRSSSWWAVTPALRDFYDYVATNYAPISRVGPQGWTIYRRTADRPVPTLDAAVDPDGRPPGSTLAQ